MKRLLGCFGLLALIGPAASASTITQGFSGAHTGSVNLSVSAINYGGGASLSPSSQSASKTQTDATQAQRQLDLFDASLGTLDSVTLRYGWTSAGFNGLGLLDEPCSASGTPAPTSCIVRTGAGVTLAYGLDFTNAGPLDQTGAASSTDLAGSVSIDFPGPDDAAFLLERVLTGAALADFTGTGTFGVRPVVTVAEAAAVSCSASNSRTFTSPFPYTSPNTAELGGCGTTVTAAYDYGYAVEVEYAYTPRAGGVSPVPLPGGLPLMLGGLGGIALLRRRRD